MAISIQQIKDFLETWINAYTANSNDFFDAFAPDASIFTVSSPTRIDGRENFRGAFTPTFTGSRRAQILSPDIQIYGDVGIVSCHSRISVDNRVSFLRTSLCVQPRPDGKLQITHMHQSPLNTPSLGISQEPGLPPEGIQLLEERVATAAAALGTPK